MPTLGTLQEEFSEALARLILFATSHPGWKIRLGEGKILQLGPDGKGRRAKHALTGLPLRVKDLVHIENSNHYRGLAIDLNLFIDGEWISSGSHGAWKILSDHWKTLHPLARAGMDFGDSNHFSFEWNGIK